MMSLNYVLTIDETSSLKAGLEDVSRESKSADTLETKKDHSSLLSFQYQRKLRPDLMGTVQHQQDFSGGNSLRPTNTNIGLQYLLTENLALSGKYKLIYGSELKTQAIFGVDSKLTENTDLVGKYEIGGTSGDSRNRASIGLNNHWMITPDITLNVAYENVATADSLELPTTEHETISISSEYLPEEPYKLTGKYEYQDNASSFKRVVSVGGDVRIGDGFGLIMKWDQFEDIYKQNADGRVRRSNLQAGLAFRPVTSDNWNALAKLAYISDFNSHVSEQVQQERLIASAQIYWQVRAHIGVAGRMATRFVHDVEGNLFNDTSRTSLINIRTDYRWSEDWSSLFDLRYLILTPLNESNFGVAAELNYAIVQDLQIGLGYIFNDIRDPDFSYLSMSHSNFYVSLHLKFDESMFEWR